MRVIMLLGVHRSVSPGFCIPPGIRWIGSEACRWVALANHSGLILKTQGLPVGVHLQAGAFWVIRAKMTFSVCLPKVLDTKKKVARWKRRTNIWIVPFDIF